jgi:hypothetical protein
MFSAAAFTIRTARLEDVPELVRLGWGSAAGWPEGPIVVGEIDGVVAAGLAIEESRVVASDAHGVPRLLAHMRARAAGISAYERTPSVSDRIRELMRGPAPVAA